MSGDEQKKKQNVFVGISLQKKRLGATQVAQIISLAEEGLNAKKINFFIADDIDRINRRIRSQCNERRIAEEIAKEGDWLEAHISQYCPPSKLDRKFIVFSRWNDVLTRSYWDLFIRVRYLFFVNADFRRDVAEIVSTFVANRGINVDKAEMHYAGEYILHEIPIMLQGIDYAGKRYRRMIYPSPGPQPLDDIVVHLRNGKYGNFPMNALPCLINRLHIG